MSWECESGPWAFSRVPRGGQRSAVMQHRCDASSSGVFEYFQYQTSYLLPKVPIRLMGYVNVSPTLAPGSYRKPTENSQTR
jgi:hypothetical protein